jgi:hypothetical protein
MHQCNAHICIVFFIASKPGMLHSPSAEQGPASASMSLLVVHAPAVAVMAHQAPNQGQKPGPKVAAGGSGARGHNTERERCGWQVQSPEVKERTTESPVFVLRGSAESKYAHASDVGEAGQTPGLLRSRYEGGGNSHGPESRSTKL